MQRPGLKPRVSVMNRFLIFFMLLMPYAGKAHHAMQP